jgi:hypothetical protein
LPQSDSDPELLAEIEAERRISRTTTDSMTPFPNPIFAIRFFETRPAMYLVPLVFVAAFVIAMIAIARR